MILIDLGDASGSEKELDSDWEEELPDREPTISL